MTDRERAESAYKDYPYNNVPRVQKDVFIEAFVMGMEAERNREWSASGRQGTTSRTTMAAERTCGNCRHFRLYKAMDEHSGEIVELGYCKAIYTYPYRTPSFTCRRWNYKPEDYGFDK